MKLRDERDVDEALAGLVEDLRMDANYLDGLREEVAEVRAQRDELMATVRGAHEELSRLRAGLESIREGLLEEECDCPPEWPRCAFCRTRLRIQVLLKGDKT